MYLDQLERGYLAGWEKRMALWARIQERCMEGRAYQHTHNTDAAMLKVLDNAGLVMARQIAQELGVDVAAVEADMIGRCADDAPQF